jgi:malate synthase
MEEAQLWNDILSFLEAKMGAEQNSFKVTVVIESILAVAQIEEIIFALKDRIVGLNAGKWNYISSIVKRFRS